MDKKDSLPGISGPFPGVEEIEKLRREHQEVSRAYDKWEEKLAEIERRIDRPASLDLGTLTKAGADRKALVHLLALTAGKDGSEWWKELIRERRDALRSLANRMETLAAEADKQAADVSFRAQFAPYFLGGGFAIGMKEPKPWKADPQSPLCLCIVSMRFLVEAYRDEAKRMTHFLRHYAQADYGLVLLLLRVFLWTRSTDHYEELARLLTDAFEAAGKSDVFSADQLRKVWDRHGKRLLRIWLKLQIEPPPEQPPTSSLGLSPRSGPTSQD